MRLAAKLNMVWNPNEPLPKTAKWIFVTGLEINDIDVDDVQLRTTQVFETEPELAAQCIARRTHRLATDEEVDRYFANRRSREDFCRKEEERVNPAVGAQRASMESTKAMMAMAQAVLANNGRLPDNEALAHEPVKGKK